VTGEGLRYCFDCDGESLLNYGVTTNTELNAEWKPLSDYTEDWK
jgi:hypothetical protein